MTNLGEPLFDGAGATKRDLVDYLDAVHELLIGELADRPLSVIRVLRGQAPFMQKNGGRMPLGRIGTRHFQSGFQSS